MSDRLTRILLGTILFAGGVALMEVRTDDVAQWMGIAVSCVAVAILMFEYALLWLQRGSSERHGFPVLPTARKATDDSPEIRDLNNVR